VLSHTDTITAIAVEFEPRRTGDRAGVEGTIWIEDQTFAIVRLAVRHTEPVSVFLPDDDFPKPLPTIFGPLRVESTAVLIEYARWDGVWLPVIITDEMAAVALHGSARARLTIRRTMTDYQVTLGQSIARLPEALCDDESEVPCHCFGVLCWQGEIILPEDPTTLIQSGELPASIFDEGDLAGAQHLAVPADGVGRGRSPAGPRARGPADDDDGMTRLEGFHGRAGLGTRPALLVVDMSLGFTDPESPLACDLEDVVVAIERLLRVARAAGLPVIYTTVAYDAGGKQTAAAFIDKVPALLTLEAGTGSGLSSPFFSLAGADCAEEAALGDRFDDFARS
jgi:hypothetical protein